MKKLFALVLSGMMLASSVPANSYAAVKTAEAGAVTTSIIKEDPSASSTQPTTSGLENAIRAVKEKITIPEEYSVFNYYYNDPYSYYDACWSFSWTNPANYAVIQVNCDANNRIVYYYTYNSDKKSASISKYLKKELETTAESFINKIAPELKNNYEYVNATFDGVYSGNYIYNFQRKNNDVAFPDNNITVSVNSVSGLVTSASIRWLYDVAVPAATTKLTEEEASKLIKENMKMKLVYRSNNYIIYDKSGIASNSPAKAFLVYEPSLNYISVDAKTGKVYLEGSQWVDTGMYNGATKEAAAMDSSTGSTTQALTEEEISKIEELKGLITKSKAIDIITSNPYLYLDKNLKSYTATLSKTEEANGDTSYIWYVNLSDPRSLDSTGNDSYRAYAYGSVDAKTGKILSFYAGMKGYFDEKTQSWKQVKIPYSKEQGKAVLEKFLKSQIKSRFENSVLVNTNDDYIAYYDVKENPIYGGYSYQYNRVHENVEYPNNNINGCVDGVTGKIYSYSSNWDNNVVFESTKGVITADKAMDYYLGNAGYGLKYEVNTINKFDSSKEKVSSLYDYKDAFSSEYEIRLVYRPDVTPYYISPFTGEQMNYDGSVVKTTAPYTYQDIKDTPENRNILLLSDMNIGFEGDNFQADKAITVGEINKLLQNIGYGYGTTKEDTNADRLITREELAQMFIKNIGLEKMSKLAGIYKTGFADESNIGSDYLGAVALAKGLGIMTGDAANNFNPKSNVTRLDAVGIILNFIAVQQQGIYY